MLLVNEVYTNETEKYRCGDSGYYQPFTDNLGKLFLTYQRDYGRCISKVYIDKDNKSFAIGWVFEKKVKYEDCNEFYLQHTWITLHNSEPIKYYSYDYRFI